MRIPLYQIDAFSDRVFGGNPAGVCPLGEEWLPDPLMQSIAAENNQAETAFFVRRAEGYAIRWFTPEVEVALCGHATLAAAWVVLNRLEPGKDSVDFDSASGRLSVARRGDRLALNFPADVIVPVPLDPVLTAGFGGAPRAAYRGKTDYLLVYDDESRIREMVVDLAAVNRVEARGIIVTAPGNDADFVSRFFAPQSGISEDPVTGSAHTTLVPYWHSVLGKTEFTARQLSRRGGVLYCRHLGDRTEIAGNAAPYAVGEIGV